MVTAQGGSPSAFEPVRVGSHLLIESFFEEVLSGRQPQRAQIFFDAAVIDRYLDHPAYRCIRTDTVGQIRKQGGWKLDVGISGGDRLLHTSIEQLAQLPDEERAHWLSHAVSLPLSVAFVQMQVHSRSCYNDGEIRPWQRSGE